jgi:hypothetical protein
MFLHHSLSNSEWKVSWGKFVGGIIPTRDRITLDGVGRIANLWRCAMATREQARKALEGLSPAPIFLEAYRSERLPMDLQIDFGPPEEFFLAPDTVSAYTDGRLIPILDDGNFGIVTFYDPDTGALLQKDVESPQEILDRFENWQQYLASLMMRFAETIDDDEDLRNIAELIGFRHFQELMAFYDHEPGEPFDQYERRRREFIDNVRD